jgi:hypothetical protein
LAVAFFFHHIYLAPWPLQIDSININLCLPRIFRR